MNVTIERETEDLAPTSAPRVAGSVLEDVPALARVAVLGREQMLRLASQPVDYVWQDIAVAGTILLLASGPSEGKTTLLFLILASRASHGAPVTLLGRALSPAPAGKFLVVIEGEHSESSAARKLVRSLRLLGIDDSALDRVILIARKAVRLGSPEWLDVVKLCTAGVVSDIAIDTVARVAPGDANDEREQVAIFDVVAAAIDAAPRPEDRPMAWCAAHTRKNGNTGDLADVSGSAQRTGQTDTVLMLKGEKAGGRTISTKVVFAKLREEPDDYPAPVTFSVLADRVVTSEQRDEDDRPLEVRIVEQLHFGPKTKGTLKKSLGRNDTDVEAALTALFASKVIETTQIKVRGIDRKAFALRSDGSARTANDTGRTRDVGGLE